MAFIPVPNVLQVELTYLWDGQTCQNVIHYEQSGPWSIADATELGTELVNWYDTTIKAFHPQTVQLVEIKMIDLSSQTGFSITFTAGLPIQGTSTADSSPNNVALVMTKRTNSRGRSFRGRIYHLGLTETAIDNSQVIPSVVAQLQVWYSELLVFTLPVAGPVNLVVVSRQQNGQPLTQGVATQVTSITTDGRVDTQRRRLPGVGI